MNTNETAYRDAIYLAIELANARGTLDEFATVREYDGSAVAIAAVRDTAGDCNECVIVEFGDGDLTPTHLIVANVTPQMFPFTDETGGFLRDGSWRGSDVLACREIDGRVGPILDFV